MTAHDDVLATADPCVVFAVESRPQKLEPARQPASPTHRPAGSTEREREREREREGGLLQPQAPSKAKGERASERQADRQTDLQRHTDDTNRHEQTETESGDRQSELDRWRGTET